MGVDSEEFEAFKDVESLSKNKQEDNESSTLGFTLPDLPTSDDCCGTTLKKSLWASFVVVVLLTGIIILSKSLQKLDSTQYGLQYNKRKKILDDAALTGGLHAGPPGFEFVKYPSTYITVDLPEDTCVSRDGLRVDISVTFQYQIIKDNVGPVTRRYRNFYVWSELVEVVGRSAVQHSCSNFDIVQFQNARGQIQTKMEENLRAKLEGEDGVFAQAISLQLRNLELPSEYNAAVQEKQEANEDIDLAKNQRQQETTKARTELLSAKEEANKIRDAARTESELLLVEAELRAQETLFAYEKEAETIVRVKNALGLTTEGVLTYLSNELVSHTSNLKVATGEIAKLSRDLV